MERTYDSKTARALRLLQERIRAGTHSALKLSLTNENSPELATMIIAREELEDEERYAEEMATRRYH